MMTTTIPAGAARVMNWRTVAELEAAGDAKTLAEALRNLITITDHATSGAQSAANARQEYVPTTLHKDDLYRAMDTALTGEAYDPHGRALYIEDDEDDLPEPNPAEGTDYRPMARALQVADDQWSSHADSDDYEPESETDTYSVFVAKMVQSILDADAVSRAKPVELRGPGSEASELARRTAQLNQFAAANLRLRERVAELEYQHACTSGEVPF